MRTYLYQSPIRRIGKREWRAVVYDAKGYLGANAFTDYEWRYWYKTEYREQWESMTTYPTYNGNDGMYSGCPKQLRKLYDAYCAEINHALSPTIT